MNLTHEEIANLAGNTRVTVSKLLSRFAKYGWIGTRYRAVALKNPAALRSFSKE
ncbi:MAG: helix-turn-helix domain-containing protein [[Clostridium] leptum]